MQLGITGASGFIGRRVIGLALGRGHEVVAFTRSPQRTIPGCEMRAFALDAPPDLRGCEAVIHLAGESVVGLWTAGKKRRIRESRVLGTQRVVEAIGKLDEPPEVFVCGSAVGFYGNAGDAELIDYMYGLRQPAPETSELGRRIFDYTTNTPAPQSVRERRKIIAAMIDEMAADSSNLRILSIACGHLREAAISNAVTNGKVAQYFALDQDALSLEVVKKELSKFNVNPVHAPIKSLFTNGKQFYDLDFVYAAGLCDYLPQSVAIKLTNLMFQMLKPNGRILLANFAPCLPEIWYLEMCMQWDLIYRTEAEVADCASEIPKEAIAGSRMFWDAPKNVIYLEIVKKSPEFKRGTHFAFPLRFAGGFALKREL